MARFWGSSTAVTSSQGAPAAAAAAAAAGSNNNAGSTTATSASTKQGGRLVRQMDEGDENYNLPPPRTPEGKATRPLRPRSASRELNYDNSNSNYPLFSVEYSNHNTGQFSEDTYDWPEQYEHTDDADRQQQSQDNQTMMMNAQQQQQQQPPRRSRMNSRDIPRSYSGLYGFSDGDLLPFELNRHRDYTGTETNTAWFLSVYLTLITAVQLLSLTIMSDMRSTWTVTNAVHFMITLVYVHWLKGSLYDEQGEMNALTVWEQLEATQGTKPVRQVLLIVPTVLTWAACWAVQYDTATSALNIALWLVAIAAKLPFMNGVRIFGINRTAGIDDNDYIDSATAAGAGTTKGNSSATTAVSSDKKTE